MIISTATNPIRLPASFRAERAPEPKDDFVRNRYTYRPLQGAEEWATAAVACATLATVAGAVTGLGGAIVGNLVGHAVTGLVAGAAIGGVLGATAAWNAVHTPSILIPPTQKEWREACEEARAQRRQP